MTKLLASLILLALALVPLPATAGAGWIAVPGSSGGGGTWGSITGTLSNQTDLQTALDAKVAGIGTPSVDGFGIRELPIYSDDTGKVITTQSGYGLYPADKLLEVGTLWFHGVQGTLGTNTTGSHFQLQGSGTWVQQPLFPYASVQPLGVSGSTHYPFSNGSIQKLHLGYDQADALASVSAGTIKVKSGINLKLDADKVLMQTVAGTSGDTVYNIYGVTGGGAFETVNNFGIYPATPDNAVVGGYYETGNLKYNAFKYGVFNHLWLGSTSGTIPAAVNGSISAPTGTAISLNTTDEGVSMKTSGSKPTCNSTHRNQFFITQGGAGVADVLEVCMKDAADAYSWVAK